MAFSGSNLNPYNKLLFIATLVISLTIFFNLSPYFQTQSSQHITINPLKSCSPRLDQIRFTNASTSLTWGWSNFHNDSIFCDFYKMGIKNFIHLLNGSRVMIAGDSQARLFVVSLLEMMLNEKEMNDIRVDLFKRHSDYHMHVDRFGLSLDFIWAPYVTNLTDFLLCISRKRTYPDVLVMGSGLWHMLHVTNAVEYKKDLIVLKGQLMSFLAVSGLRPRLFWIGMPKLVNSMLNTEKKRARMTNVNEVAYVKGVESSDLLMPNGPLMLLDIRTLSSNCGVGCTKDGLHYDGVVYNAAVHIMLNALLIQSKQ